MKPNPFLLSTIDFTVAIIYLLRCLSSGKKQKGHMLRVQLGPEIHSCRP